VFIDVPESIPTNRSRLKRGIIMQPNHVTADEVLKIHNEIFYGG
jgi:hypothetical protein